MNLSLEIIFQPSSHNLNNCDDTWNLDCAGEWGGTAVIDKKFILGGKTDFDITNIIVEKLNKELPSLNLK